MPTKRKLNNDNNNDNHNNKKVNINDSNINDSNSSNNNSNKIMLIIIITMIIVINVRIEIMLYSRKLFKISFFIIMGKIFKPLLNLSQIYGPKNGMLFCAKFFSKVS